MSMAYMVGGLEATIMFIACLSIFHLDELSNSSPVGEYIRFLFKTVSFQMRDQDCPEVPINQPANKPLVNRSALPVK